MPKKTLLPPKPQTGVIYTRVSTTDQAIEGFSLDAQLKALRAYVKLQGLKLTAEFVDAESGSKTGRTEFGKMLAHIRAQGTDAIVVEKTDRLYRNFTDLVKVDELGVEVHFVKENLVISPRSSSSDKLVHGVKVVLAKHFSDNLREETKKGMMEKMRQGLFPSWAPIGYVNVQRGHVKTIEPDPERAHLIVQMFELYGRRSASIRDLSKFARQNGLKGLRGGSLSLGRIGEMLQNPIYMGIIKWGGETHVGSHEPLITAALFDRVQEVMHGKKANAGSGAVELTYRGMITCAYCGCTVTGEIKKGKYTYYHCTAKRDASCPGRKAVRGEVISEQFASLLSHLQLSQNDLERLRQALRESLDDEKRMRDHHVGALERSEKDLRRKLETMYLDKINGNAPRGGVYESVKAKVEMDLAEVEVALRGLKTAEVKYFAEGEKMLELAQTAGLRFKRADDALRREIALELIESCQMRDGRLEFQVQKPYDSMLSAAEKNDGNGKYWSGSPDGTRLTGSNELNEATLRLICVAFADALIRAA